MGRRISETVQRRAFVAGAEDAHGNPVESWASGVSVGVYGFDPGGSDESRIPGHDRVITSPKLFVPDGVVFAARDRVVARGLLYEVEGDTAVWRHPNGKRPGNVVELRRVDG